ncbi:MAG: DUF4249 family protein [Emticicia sp.]|uniref:DUF4249 family protein n=1 Tax=Emticicia sp. TaxID=1930953 RepID=UPI003BA5BC56
MKAIKLIIVFFICTSCEKWKVEENTADINNLIAVSSLVSPTTPLMTVYVSKGILLGQVIKNDSLQITNAEVSISDGTTTQKLLYNPTDKRYEALQDKLKVISGKTYYLTVKVNNKTLEASCIVPNKPQIQAIKNRRTDNGIQFSLNWKNTEKAYLIESIIDGVTATNLPTKLSIIWDSDNTRASVIKSSVLDEFIYTGRFPIPSNIRLKNIFTTVSSIDQNYEFFIERRGKVDSDVGIFERFSEPNLGYSNIKGGIGIFGAVYPITVENEIIR